MMLVMISFESDGLTGKIKHGGFSQLYEVDSVIEDNQRLYKLLVYALNKATIQHQYKLPDKESVMIFSLGCGSCGDHLALNSFFSRKPFKEVTDKVKLIGVDMDERQINVDRRKYERILAKENVDESDIEILEKNLQLFHGDARDLSNIKGFPKEKADVVLIRRPLLGFSLSQGCESAKIIHQGAQKLKDDGLMVITTLMPGEISNLKKNILPGLNLQIIGEARIDASGYGDSNIVLLRKNY